jgi:hypothetical protein
MLALTFDSRDAVVAFHGAAVRDGGTADVNPLGGWVRGQPLHYRPHEHLGGRRGFNGFGGGCGGMRGGEAKSAPLPPSAPSDVPAQRGERNGLGAFVARFTFSIYAPWSSQTLPRLALQTRSTTGFASAPSHRALRATKIQLRATNFACAEAFVACDWMVRA